MIVEETAAFALDIYAGMTGTCTTQARALSSHAFELFNNCVEVHVGMSLGAVAFCRKGTQCLRELVMALKGLDCGASTHVHILVPSSSSSSSSSPPLLERKMKAWGKMHCMKGKQRETPPKGELGTFQAWGKMHCMKGFDGLWMFSWSWLGVVTHAAQKKLANHGHITIKAARYSQWPWAMVKIHGHCECDWNMVKVKGEEVWMKAVVSLWKGKGCSSNEEEMEKPTHTHDTAKWVAVCH
ncbi:hypothetical protein F5148DRAFT_1151876, partial [Russula earlei]